MKTILQLSEYGSSFATREKAKVIADDVARRVSQQTDEVILSFDGVRVVSYSFADQILGDVSLMIRPGSGVSRLSLTGCNGAIMQVLQEVFKRRSRIAHSPSVADITADSIAIATA